MSTELPKGWVSTPLAEVCLPVVPIHPEDYPDTEFTYFDIGGIDNERNRISETKSITGNNAPSRAKYPIRKGDILFSTVRTYLRKIARVEREYANPIASSGFVVIRPAEGVSSEFLFFQLLSDEFLRPLHLLQSGSNYPAIRDSDVLSQSILLPPSAEQVRIAEKLKATLTQIADGENAIHRAQEEARQYRDSVLRDAVTGELTREWREVTRHADVNSETGDSLLKRLLIARRLRSEEAESLRLHLTEAEAEKEEFKGRYREPSSPTRLGLWDIPEGWAWTNLSQLKIYSLYGPRFSRDYYVKDGIAVLRTTDIDESGRVSLEDCPKLALTDEEYEKYKVEVGDLLITRTGSVGTVAVFKDTVKAIPGAYLLHYRLVEPKVVEFVYTFLRSPIGQKRLWEESAGSGRQNLSAPGLERIVIPLPPLHEQFEIVSEVNRRLLATERLATTLEAQLARAKNTRQLLFREAFAGRLVPQALQDEPSTLLLQRIRLDREAEAAKPRVKRMPKTKSALTRRPLLDVIREYGKPITPEQLFNRAGFKPAQVDLFYRELAQLRDKLREKKPTGSDAKSWPERAHVTLELEESI